MSSLEKYINSGYMEAANALNGKCARRRVLAYVESYDDVFFWRSILSQLETAELTFQVMLPSRSRKLERGKKAALMAAMQDRVGTHMIACVDADYDYLRQGSNAFSEMVCHNPYVFHTYAYAIENLQCWSKALREVCVMATLNDSAQMLDFESFLAAYSEKLYPLFVWSVLLSRYPALGSFSFPDFVMTTKTGTVRRNNTDEILKHVGDKVRRKLQQVERNVTTKAKQRYNALKTELNSLGVFPHETYLYIQGHSLFKDVVLPMLSAECDELVKQREEEIRAQSIHHTQYDNELACYEHSLASISSMLRKHAYYISSPQVQRIITDLRKYISTIKPQTENNDATTANHTRQGS